MPELEDGTLAGSVLTMDEALRNVVGFTGCTLPEAVRVASTTPAALIGERRKGVLAAGCDADVVALTPELGVQAVWVGGERVYG
jgi:N-acetylglucosamine-6-phosphate deacetylase